MKLLFKRPVQIEIVTGIEGDEPETELEVFAEGDTTEVDICDGLVPPDASNVQFGDGSVAFVTPEFWEAVTIL